MCQDFFNDVMGVPDSDDPEVIRANREQRNRERAEQRAREHERQQQREMEEERLRLEREAAARSEEEARRREDVLRQQMDAMSASAAASASPDAAPDTAYLDAQARERARQSAINSGRGTIDQLFGRFDDSFFDQIRADADTYYRPQIEQDFTSARDRMTTGLARQGILESSAAAQKFGMLEQQKQGALGELASQLAKRMQDMRSNVDTQKNQLYQLNSSVADPSIVGTQALNAVQRLDSAPTSYGLTPSSFRPIVNDSGSTFENLFADMARAGSNFVAADQRRVEPVASVPTPRPTPLPRAGGGTGSVRVVG